MEGVRVVELAFWVAGPSVAGILADWGAEVVKIEPRDGDPMRAFYSAGLGIDLPINPAFELDNRGKRSVVLDFENAEARRIAFELIDRADVFVTNFRPAALERLGFDYPSLSGRNPRLVYASVTGYGLEGPDRDRPAFDAGAYWSRAGVAAALLPADRDPPIQRPAMGDHFAGLAGAAGVSAALFARHRSGRGQLVSTSLLRIGVFQISCDVNVALRLGAETIPAVRQDARNPAISCYRAADGKWFWLLGLQADRHWPDLARSVGHPEWIDDPRFRSLSIRTANCTELISLLDEIFATKTRAEWAAIFDREGMWWSPIQTTLEVLADPQVAASGAFVDVPIGETTARMVATPVDFSDPPWSVRSGPPEAGQHTEEVLLELGYDWEAIGRLKENGAIP